ncbi:MAG TPA: hypothetical protein VJ867_13840 [Gemmatimonadaceae bacterium]|nr:hypothetical protein [Gemmatimonadaceae bacterium]
MPPVLEFPERGLDDTAAYRGYRTRFYRDVAGNTVQIYVNDRDGRVVNLWADADDESLGFTARTARGRPAALQWVNQNAVVSTEGRARVVQYRLRTDAPAVALGAFLLGSMRVERDFQYAGRDTAAFDARPFPLLELEQMFTALERADSATRAAHLALIGAPDLETLRARTSTSLDIERGDSTWAARITQPSLDGRDTLWLELVADVRRVTGSIGGDSVILRSRSGRGVDFTVRVGTTGKPLTRLTRQEIFTPDFLTFLARAKARGGMRARWLEREVRGVELLSSHEKLMAGLPNYATYFGRDMLMSALMMRTVWRAEMSEFAIASALRKLGPAGDVSHEEALGGQAVRENAVAYANLMNGAAVLRRAGRDAAADSVVARASELVAHLRRTRENYHMIDDEFQLPVLVARWIADSSVSVARKRAFLLDTADYGETRLARLLRELALVARMTQPYVAQPDATHLVSFPARDSTHWQSASWRDSGAGYAGGRFAMDVNAIWAPSALEGIATIFDALRSARLPVDSLASSMPELAQGAPLGDYARSASTLRGAVDTWWGAWRHFVVRLAPEEIRSHVNARLATLKPDERAYWTGVMRTSRASDDTLEFLALSLDTDGRPIAVANTDPATGLFLGHDRRAAMRDSAARARVNRDVRAFTLDYPVGLFVDRVGPLVVNDAYATPDVWSAFDRDLYHGPRVVWGREVNLFLLGATGALEDATRAGGANGTYARGLRTALDRVLTAVEGSGFKSELWSYEFRRGRPQPVRYSTGSDVQLWSTTDLAVQYALSRLGIR